MICGSKCIVTNENSHRMDNLQRMSENVYPVVPEGGALGGQVPELRQGCTVGDTCSLTEEIRGAKGRQYGREGDRVKIISDHDNVMIVENIGPRERFPVPVTKLKPTA